VLFCLSGVLALRRKLQGCFMSMECSQIECGTRDGDMTVNIRSAGLHKGDG